MEKTTVLQIIGIPVARAWEIISRLNGLEKFLPFINKSYIEQNDDFAERIIEWSNGLKSKETVFHLDHRGLEIHYTVQDPSPLPFTNYIGQIKIHPFTPHSCAIECTGIYQPLNKRTDQTDRLLKKVFHSSINRLERHYKSILKGKALIN